MKLAGRILLSLALTSLTLLSGCATFDRAKAPPPQSQPIAVSFTNEELSGWSDLPIGAYRIPDSQMIISGHQKGGAAGLLFGVIGIAIQNAVETNNGKESIKDIENTLRVTLTEQAQGITKSLISSGQFDKKFTTQAEANTPTLSVFTSVIATYVNDTDVRPYIVLSASYKDAKTKEPIWSTRYFVSSGKALPLVGDVSWTANGGEALKRTLTANLEKGIKVMLADVSSPYPRNEAALHTVQGNFPYVRPRFQINGYNLQEDADTLVFVPRVGDVIVFAGVNVMDKSMTSLRLMTKDDPFWKVLPEEKLAAEK
jgi:hypothetical protein